MSAMGRFQPVAGTAEFSTWPAMPDQPDSATSRCSPPTATSPSFTYMRPNFYELAGRWERDGSLRDIYVQDTESRHWDRKIVAPGSKIRWEPPDTTALASRLFQKITRFAAA